MATLQRYLELVQRDLLDRKGDGVARLLSLAHSHSTTPWVASVPDSLLDEMAAGLGIREPWDAIVLEHLSVCYQRKKGQVMRAYSAQIALAKLFNDELRSHKERNWALPVLYSVGRDLRLLAKQVDRVCGAPPGGGAAGGRHRHMEEAANILNDCFRILSADVRSGVDNTKRQGMLYVANQLFKIYHYIQRPALCVSLFKAIDSVPNALFYKFTKSQKVTYNFYAGRTYLYDGNIERATKCLQYSFESCHRLKRRNKRLISIFLTQAKMSLGYLPRRSLLEKYSITEYGGIAHSIRSGDVTTFHHTLATHRTRFEEWGVYWLLLQLEPLVYRTLFKRAYQISQSPGGATSISLFTTALAVSRQNGSGGGGGEGEEEGEMETGMRVDAETVLSNLIDKDLVKGYISHSHGKVVLSKGPGAFVTLPVAVASQTTNK